MGVKAVNVSSLKNNPSEALRYAREDMVLVMNRDQPDALMIGLNQMKLLDMPGVRAALATSLFKGGDLSLARSARLAKMTLVDFIAHASRLGIPIISQTAQEVEQDMDTLDQWLAL
jgi:predicted HTH domain antitoxin